MAIRSSTDASLLVRDKGPRRVLLPTAFSLLFIALLAPFAQFGVLKALIVPDDAAVTTNNIAASMGIFQAAILAFLIVAILDVVVAWGFYHLLRPVNTNIAVLVGSLRIVYAVAFALAFLNLVDAARLVDGATATAVQSASLQGQVASAVASFDTVWHMALGIFGLHLVGLGALLFGFAAPRLLAALVVMAGAGYLADSIGTIFIADYGLTVSTFTFVGEALLIFWLFWRAVPGISIVGDGCPLDGPRVRGGRVMTPVTPANPFTRILGGLLMNNSSRSISTRSPVLAILGSLFAGAGLAAAFLFTLASGGSEPLVTGSVLIAFGLGWGLMASTTSRFSAQPQAWTVVPAIALGSIGLGLIVFQPGAAVMDILSWVWPPGVAVLAIWMVIQVRGHLHGRGRWLVVPMIATLLVFAISGALTTVSTATAIASTGAGKVIDVGGHRLYIECTGSGGPAVILQAGLGASSYSWADIAPAIATTTTVCAYDRAGHGRSEGAGRQDGIALATDLKILLERAGVAGPYVIVGHSSGGPYVRVFAEQYPDDVAGMVLLDAQPADAFTALPEYPGVYATFRTLATVSPSLARVGLLGPVLGLPADESSPAIARGASDEILALPTVLQQSALLTSIGDRPLIVVTAVAEADPGWVPAQDNLPRLSTAGVHRVMANATHNSLISGVDVGASIQAILDVLTSIRAGTALR